MSPLIFILLATAGGVGAGVRYLVDHLIRSRTSTKFAWATTVINASGSLALGFLTGLLMTQLLPTGLGTEMGVVLGTGFLGGYTTFSTASYETVALVRERRYGAALLNGVGMLLLCIALAGLGMFAGMSL
ncbi:fluoride efflux transporter CrcB [Klugiella xanthotipulae]|uniref:Fluoride-specific ion channel FluC n=1 Tax=Klugiella xanthotipulae TaxID=244735 RepID=A0A543HH38_9MICO|nr:CrcB family protein [Klugiella xanthotipulae]TQM57640.1 camphor resistance protein CrcB [Klugiella xanthotipulae]